MPDLLTLTIYILGFIGLAAITVLPIRFVQMLRRHRGLWSSSAVGKIGLVLLLSLGVGAIACEVYLVARVFQCLIGEHCGPNRASGWLFLSSIGVWYIAFELLALAISSTARKLGRGAA